MLAGRESPVLARQLVRVFSAVSLCTAPWAPRHPTLPQKAAHSFRKHVEAPVTRQARARCWREGSEQNRQ